MKEMRKLLILIPLLLAACTATDGPKVDLSTLRQQCSELSGYTGNAQYVEDMGIVFVWRADDKEVAECEWNGGDVKLVGILGHGHPGDTPDGEFYDREAIERCTAATEVYFGWEGKVEWEAHAALAFFNDYKNLQMVTARGKHPEGTVWADCAINHDTDRVIVYDFAPGPYNPTIEPDELLTP